MTAAPAPNACDRPPPLARTVSLFGEAAGLKAALLQAAFRETAPAALLVNAGPYLDPDTVVDRCRTFAESLTTGEEALIVTIVSPARRALDEWKADASAAGLLSFTRQAALAWGPRHIRVNMIEAAPDVPDSDIAAAILALVDLPSVTGQSWHLGS